MRAVAFLFPIGALASLLDAFAGGGPGSAVLWWLQVGIVWPVLLLAALICLPLSWLRGPNPSAVLAAYLVTVSLLEAGCFLCAGTKRLRLTGLPRPQYRVAALQLLP